MRTDGHGIAIAPKPRETASTAQGATDLHSFGLALIAGGVRRVEAREGPDRVAEPLG